ncbi:MAG: WD40 repeat domain-containing protein [Terriglobales bacterium]
MMTLEPVRTLPVEEYLLSRLAFSPDGAVVAIGHKHFRTYAVEGGETRAEFHFPEFLARLRFSPDGRYIAAANVGDNHPATQGRVELFDAATGQSLWSVAEPQPVEAMAFAPDGVRLFWNAGSAIAMARCEPRQALAPQPLEQLRVLDLAHGASGLAVFARETVGSVQQIEGAELIFRKFRLLRLDGAGHAIGNLDLGIGAGVHALSPDGKLLACEMVDFKNNERHVALIDVETGVEANLLPLEANTLPVLGFGLGSEFFLCMKEDANEPYNRLRIWRTSDLKLVGEATLDLAFHSFATCLEYSLVACLGGGQLAMFSVA